MPQLSCKSKIWQHKLQQTSLQSAESIELQNRRLATRRTTASSEAQLHVGASATRVSPDIRPSSSFALHTEHKEHTHDERNISATQHITFTLKGFERSDACLNSESHASAKTSLDVPPNLSPVKANSCDTGDLPHITQTCFRRLQL